ncbi:MAG: hypothetical protein AAB460_00320 [Patescibacteria group bacterium]
MTPEERKMLEETLALSRENNIVLKKLRRGALWGRAMHLLYWVVIIGTTVGAFYFLQPLLDQFGSIYGGFQGAESSFQGLFGN